MLKNYFIIAWRNLSKNKAYTFINIGGLTLGIAVTLIIGLWVYDELSYNDYFESNDRIAQVFQSQTFNGNTFTTPAIPLPLEPALRDAYMDNFEYLTMASWTYSQTLEYNNNTFSILGNYMQEEGPKILDLKITQGDKNGLRELNSIMISETTAEILFGTADPIGKILTLDGQHKLTVTSVYETVPQNNSFNDMQFIVPWKKYVATQDWLRESLDNWGNNSFQMFVKLADNVPLETASETIRNVKKNADEEVEEFNPQLFLMPMKDWYLRSNFEQGKQTGGRIKYVWLFTTLGVFVLILACINFMNLSTARSEKRAKEVGVRKAIGSQRGQLVNQFLGESFLVVSIASAVAILIVLLCMDSFNELSRKTITFPWTNPLFWLTFLAFIVFTATIAGSYPALFLSSFNPVEVLKGTFRAGKKASTPRKVLVIFQFTVSVAFIIGTVVVMQQINHAKNRPVGYERNGLIQVPVFSSDYDGKYNLMRELLIKSGAVVEMSSSSSPTTQIWSSRSGFIWEGKPEGFQEDFDWTYVSVDFARSLNLKIVEGRDFSRDFPSDSLGVLVNETAVKYMGLTDPIGQIIRDDSEEDPDPPMTIIGVVQDMVVQSPYEPTRQGLYVYDREGEGSYYNLRLNPNKSVRENLAIVERVFKGEFPALPFQFDFVDEEYGNKFASEERVGKLSGIFTALAILISCLGLFGLTSFVAEQRTKEIGVRKVLGASAISVWNMLSKDFLKLIMISCLIAIPLSFYIMHGWLQDYPYRITMKWWIFFLAVVGAVFMTLITVSFQSLRAARANPIKSLRTE
ncbi:MAG: ABC transporter permease [Bacteroidota bacterium]